MDGAPSPSADRVRLWPYAQGVYGRDALYRVWKAMEEDGATHQAFWDEPSGEMGADLANFVRLFSGADRVLLMIERTDTGNLCGCFWVSQMTPGHQAFVGMWMHNEARGGLSVEAARLALQYTFEMGHFRQLWALTPWPAAGALCRATGFALVARLKDFCQWEQAYKDVQIFRLTKEAWDGIYFPQGI